MVGAVDSKLILIFGETDGSLNEAGPNQAVMMRLVGGPDPTPALLKDAVIAVGQQIVVFSFLQWTRRFRDTSATWLK